MERIARRMEMAADIILGEAGAGISAARVPRPLQEIERRRHLYRPDHVRILFVVPPVPDPPEPTDFYLVNSHLYRCVRAAFVVMNGEQAVPSGDAFLEYFKAHGCWLVALPGELRRERGRPSNDAHAAEIEYLIRLLRDTAPTFVVGIKPRVARLLREAAAQADFPARAVEPVRVPKDLWQDRFVRRLRRMIAEPDGESGSRIRGNGRSAGVADAVSLATVAEVFQRNRNKRMRVYQIAEWLAPLGTAIEKDAMRSQLRRLLKQHRESFDQNGAGIRLAGLDGAEPSGSTDPGDASVTVGPAASEGAV
jgi:hypothetical protein